jgi:hypothetical protein
MSVQFVVNDRDESGMEGLEIVLCGLMTIKIFLPFLPLSCTDIIISHIVWQI